METSGIYLLSGQNIIETSPIIDELKMRRTEYSTIVLTNNYDDVCMVNLILTGFNTIHQIPHEK